ncbi:MAG: ABC transporter permease [Bacillota bacterium]|nr:ABC transporter permease [Bacillota bacterium]
MMACTMFLKECRQIMKSSSYIIFVIVLIAFGYSQIKPEFVKIEKPQQGQESYGTKYEEKPEIIMTSAVKSLYGEFAVNSYTAYPVGFYKKVKLNSKHQLEMAEILSKLSGISADKLPAYAGTETAGEAAPENPDTITLDVKVDKNLSYEQFLSIMEKTDKLIGGGSKYGHTYLIRFGKMNKTYEDALSEYNDILEKDRITGAYARLFCDYLGIILGLFPVFLAAAYGMKDRRAGMRELIYTRKASSLKIVFIRYFSMAAMMFLPVLIMAVYASIQVAGNYAGFNLDKLAFIKYSIGWLLPTLMVSAAAGTFMTELTDTPIAIAVQGIWWFIGLFSGMKHIDGGYGTDLVLRHNMIGNTQVYLRNYPILLVNRISYIIAALMLILFTAWIYELKRRGGLNGNFGFKKIFSNPQGKCKA